jgi:hypothetical protein
MQKIYPTLSDVLLAVAVTIAIVSLAGYELNMPLLVSWGAAFVTMKEKTAFLMVDQAWSAYVISKAETRKECLPALFIALPTVLVSAGLSADIKNYENLISTDPTKAHYPSLATILCFALLSTKCFLVVASRSPWPARVAGALVSLVGASGVVGYVFGLPLLYFVVPGYCTAMAVNTAICFLLLGAVYIPRTHSWN